MPVWAQVPTNLASEAVLSNFISRELASLVLGADISIGFKDQCLSSDD